MYNQDYLNKLIENKIEENLNLDYKASGALQKNDKKTNEISKDVSAFANSDGGLIIYGINEDDENKHLPRSIDPVDRELITKEWLEQIIQSKIRPRIDGIVIHPIEINNSNKDVVYLVDIPQSSTVHQADDRKYYKRFNFNSVPMYDYEIKDILNRVKTPIINLEFEIINRKIEYKPEISTLSTINQKDSNTETKSEFHLEVYAKNEGKVLAQYLNCYVSIPDTCIEEKQSTSRKGVTTEYFADNTVRDVVDVKMGGTEPIVKYGPSRYDPILPRMRMKLDISIPKLGSYFYDYENIINWVVYADNSEPIKGKIRFNEIEDKRE
jgi:Schlafen, AlbA_2